MFTLSPGEKVHVLRRRRGLTQVELAERAGTTRTTIIVVENERTSPSPELVEQLAAALAVSPAELTP